jgi:hypothetical protein
MSDEIVKSPYLRIIINSKRGCKLRYSHQNEFNSPIELKIDCSPNETQGLLYNNSLGMVCTLSSDNNYVDFSFEDIQKAINKGQTTFMTENFKTYILETFEKSDDGKLWLSLVDRGKKNKKLIWPLSLFDSMDRFYIRQMKEYVDNEEESKNTIILQ